MGQITVTKANGTGTVILGTTHPAVTIVSAKHEMSIMEEDKVVITVESPTYLNITLQDYIDVFSRRYVLNSPPTVSKKGSNYYRFDYTFEGPMYELNKVIAKMKRENFAASSEFSLMGDLKNTFCPFVEDALNYIGNYTWTCDAPVSSVVKNLSFSNETVLEAVNKMADEFGMEWYIEAYGVSQYNFIFTAKAGTDLSATDIYKLGLGFTEIKRSVNNSEPFCTRLFPTGANKNIPSNYRDYSQRLLPLGSSIYIENATAKTNWGLVEFAKTWDDIFPTRTGTVSSLGANELTFVDSGMDFDLNSYLLPGLTAKVHFQTGKLAGYEFTMTSYTHATKTFVIKSQTDERGLTLPHASNAEFKIAVGDTYKLIDIQLPASYITAAEIELLNTATEWLSANCNPIVTYDVEMDYYYIKNNMHGRSLDFLFAPGDIINLYDYELGLNDNLRILSFSRDIINPYKYSFNLGTAPFRNPAYRLISRIKKNFYYLRFLGIDDPAKLRLDKWSTIYAQSQANQS